MVGITVDGSQGALTYSIKAHTNTTLYFFRTYVNSQKVKSSAV